MTKGYRTHGYRGWKAAVDRRRGLRRKLRRDALAAGPVREPVTEDED
jgi:hypothetical protein